jgi:electron transport complex protein RnfA
VGDYAVIFLGAGLVNNLILDAALGLPPAIAVAKKIAAAADMTLAMMLAITAATVLTYPLEDYVLQPLGLGGFAGFSFILIITLGILTVEALLRRFQPALHDRIAVFVPLTLINGAALGAGLLNSQRQHGVFGSLFFGIGAAAGFGLVVIALAAMQERLMPAEIPAPFRGVAIILITLGIMAMAFMGFTGIVSL